jgi:DnaJ-class molecular chaperone
MTRILVGGEVVCEDCDGTGEVDTGECVLCDGTGIVDVIEDLDGEES